MKTCLSEYRESRNRIAPGGSGSRLEIYSNMATPIAMSKRESGLY